MSEPARIGEVCFEVVVGRPAGSSADADALAERIRATLLPAVDAACVTAIPISLAEIVIDLGEVPEPVDWAALARTLAERLADELGRYPPALVAGAGLREARDLLPPDPLLPMQSPRPAVPAKAPDLRQLTLALAALVASGASATALADAVTRLLAASARPERLEDGEAKGLTEGASRVVPHDTDGSQRAGSDTPPRASEVRAPEDRGETAGLEAAGSSDRDPSEQRNRVRKPSTEAEATNTSGFGLRRAGNRWQSSQHPSSNGGNGQHDFPETEASDDSSVIASTSAVSGNPGDYGNDRAVSGLDGTCSDQPGELLGRSRAADRGHPERTGRALGDDVRAGSDSANAIAEGWTDLPVVRTEEAASSGPGWLGPPDRPADPRAAEVPDRRASTADLADASIPTVPDGVRVPAWSMLAPAPAGELRPEGTGPAPAGEPPSPFGQGRRATTGADERLPDGSFPAGRQPKAWGLADGSGEDPLATAPSGDMADRLVDGPAAVAAGSGRSQAGSIGDGTAAGGAPGAGARRFESYKPGDEARSRQGSEGSLSASGAGGAADFGPERLTVDKHAEHRLPALPEPGLAVAGLGDVDPDDRSGASDARDVAIPRLAAGALLEGATVGGAGEPRERWESLEGPREATANRPDEQPAPNPAGSTFTQPQSRARSWVIAHSRDAAAAKEAREAHHAKARSQAGFDVLASAETGDAGVASRRADASGDVGHGILPGTGGIGASSRAGNDAEARRTDDGVVGSHARANGSYGEQVERAVVDMPVVDDGSLGGFVDTTSREAPVGAAARDRGGSATLRTDPNRATGRSDDSQTVPDRASSPAADDRMNESGRRVAGSSAGDADDRAIASAGRLARAGGRQEPAEECSAPAARGSRAFGGEPWRRVDPAAPSAGLRDELSEFDPLSETGARIQTGAAVPDTWVGPLGPLPEPGWSGTGAGAPVDVFGRSGEDRSALAPSSADGNASPEDASVSRVDADLGREGARPTAGSVLLDAWRRDAAGFERAVVGRTAEEICRLIEAVLARGDGVPPLVAAARSAATTAADPAALLREVLRRIVKDRPIDLEDPQLGGAAGAGEARPSLVPGSTGTSQPAERSGGSRPGVDAEAGLGASGTAVPPDARNGLDARVEAGEGNEDRLQAHAAGLLVGSAPSGRRAHSDEVSSGSGDAAQVAGTGEPASGAGDGPPVSFSAAVLSGSVEARVARLVEGGHDACEAAFRTIGVGLGQRDAAVLAVLRETFAAGSRERDRMWEFSLLVALGRVGPVEDVDGFAALAVARLAAGERRARRLAATLAGRIVAQRPWRAPAVTAELVAALNALASAEPVGESDAAERAVTGTAGLVLVAAYLPMLFDRLAITERGGFRTPEAPDRAMDVLWRIAWGGEPPSGETARPLERLLCGIAAEQRLRRPEPVERAEVVEELLAAVIARWAALGATSLAGLREAFLRREGVLTLGEAGWMLEVAPRAYDMLLDRLPWGYGIVRLPWMTAALRVKWRD